MPPTEYRAALRSPAAG